VGAEGCEKEERQTSTRLIGSDGVIPLEKETTPMSCFDRVMRDEEGVGFCFRGSLICSRGEKKKTRSGPVWGKHSKVTYVDWW